MSLAIETLESVTYILLSSDSVLLARGRLISPPDSPTLKFQILEGDIDALVAAQTIRAIGSDPEQAPLLGRFLQSRKDIVVFQPLEKLGEKARQNLRVPVSFTSLAYPANGGRTTIRSVDLSCGGIAFVTPRPFELHEPFELVIPITAGDPLLVWAEIIRIRTKQGELFFYAARFKDLVREQEERIREAVFSIQIRQRKQERTARTPQ